jgi:hypothetical protein
MTSSVTATMTSIVVLMILRGRMMFSRDTLRYPLPVEGGMMI